MKKLKFNNDQIKNNRINSDRVKLTGLEFNQK